MLDTVMPAVSKQDGLAMDLRSTLHNRVNLQERDTSHYRTPVISSSSGN